MKESDWNLAWKLNWWRQSELEGSLLLGRMVALAKCADLCRKLTRHCAEEAEHSRLWAEVLGELELPYISICKSFQSFYVKHAGAPRSLVEVLAFTQVFERRVHRRFRAESRVRDLPVPVKAAYARMIDDERQHLSWVAEWLRSQPGSKAEVQRFLAADQKVFSELQSFEQCIWRIPGLGKIT